jgi:hypothetical protein
MKANLVLELKADYTVCLEIPGQRMNKISHIKEIISYMRKNNLLPEKSSVEA